MSSGPHFIHFKLKSAGLSSGGSAQWTTISWEGANHLSTLEVKRLIAQHFKMNNQDGFDFLLTNSTTGEEYRDDNFIIHRNTSLTVKRIMGTKERAQILTQPATIGKLIGSDQVAQSSSPSNNQSNEQLNEQVSDEQAILNLVQQSSRTSRQPASSSYAPQTYQRQSHGTGANQPANQSVNSKPPPSYVCHRCGGNGHYIRYCPTNGDPSFDGRKPKAAAAVAQYEASNQKFFLKQIEDPKALAASEKPAEPGSNQAFDQSFNQSFNPSQQQQQQQQPYNQSINQPSPVPHVPQPPRDLCCSLCGQLFVSPQVLPCCFKTVCATCIHTGLRNSQSSNCPLCAAHIDVKALKPNHMIGSRVASFQQQQRAAGIYVPPTLPPVMPQLIPAHPTNQPINQPINQPPPMQYPHQYPPQQGYYPPPPMNHPMHQQINQSINQPNTSPNNHPANPPVNQPMYQPLNQPNNQPINPQMYPPPPGGSYPPHYQSNGYQYPPPDNQSSDQSFNQSFNQSNNQSMPYQQYPPPSRDPRNSQSNIPRNDPRNDPRMNQPNNQSFNQPSNPSFNQPNNQPNNQPINQPNNQSFNQSNNQSRNDPRDDRRNDRNDPRRNDRNDRSTSRGNDRSYRRSRSRSPRRNAPYSRRSRDRSPRRSPPRRRE